METELRSPCILQTTQQILLKKGNVNILYCSMMTLVQQVLPCVIQNVFFFPGLLLTFALVVLSKEESQAGQLTGVLPGPEHSQVKHREYNYVSAVGTNLVTLPHGGEKVVYFLYNI